MNLVHTVTISALAAVAGSVDDVPRENGPSQVTRGSAVATIRDQLRHFGNWRTDLQAPALAFALASPENRERIGSVGQFRTLLETPQYRPLIENRGWLCGTATPLEGGRVALVTIIDRSGRLAAFRYYVRSDTSQTESPWVIDAVVRVPLEEGIDPGGES